MPQRGRHARQTLPSRLVPAGLERPGLGRALDRQHQRGLDVGGHVPRPRPRHRARLLRLHAARRLDLYRPELAELARDLPEERDRKSTRLNSSHTVIYPLSLHDALPISRPRHRARLLRLHAARRLDLYRPELAELARDLPEE